MRHSWKCDNNHHYLMFFQSLNLTFWRENGLFYSKSTNSHEILPCFVDYLEMKMTKLYNFGFELLWWNCLLPFLMFRVRTQHHRSNTTWLRSKYPLRNPCTYVAISLETHRVEACKLVHPVSDSSSCHRIRLIWPKCREIEHFFFL